jgi:hypothetical protein
MTTNQIHMNSARYLALFLAVLLFSGCAGNRQYRTNYSIGTNDTSSDNVLIDKPEYLLGFVEFDDQGWMWDRRQLTNVLERITEENHKQPLLMVVFAHGWKHNAGGNDENVRMFEKTLEQLHGVEQKLSVKENRKARRIAGVYIGWRGLSATMEPFKELSFWSRKERAHEIGRGSVTELLSGLEAIRKNTKHVFPDRNPPTKLIVVGHSFGGALVYSAVAPFLVGNTVDTIDDTGVAHPPRGFGDLVILINPAFESARFEPLRSTTLSRRFFPKQPGTLAIFTSKTDSATKFWFVVGRRLSTFFESHRDSFQKQSNIRTPGHFSKVVTHNLTPRRGTSKRARVETRAQSEQTTSDQSAEQVVKIKQQLQKADKFVQSPPFTAVDLKPTANYQTNSPVYVVSVDGTIIQGHGGITHPTFITFLREFVLAFASGTSD